MKSDCYAPYNNMYFSTDGNVSPCWLLLGSTERWDGTKTIKEIWEGDVFKRYRDNLSNGVFEGSCNVCKKNIDNGVWSLSKAYEELPVSKYPSLLELELSNQCNLECIMCEGRLSSGIRKNRDKLPPLPMLYDSNFVKQLEEFVPHLTELRINGGEPFAQSIVYDICMMVSEINPNLRITIATNGTVYNKQVQRILNKCNIHLNISIDSLQKNTYESIRINGVFEDLMVNFHKFKEYCHTNTRTLSVMVNPMRNNWKEMGDFVRFCDEHNVDLWYNTIHHPQHLTLWGLDKNTLEEVYNTLRAEVLQMTEQKVSERNLHKFRHLVNNQIKTWAEKKTINIPIISV